MGELSYFCSFVSVSSVTQSCLTLCDPRNCSMSGLPVQHQLLEFMSIELVMPSNHLILCCPLFLLPSIFPGIRVFLNKLVLRIRWPKKIEYHRIDAFELWCWRRLLRVPWTARRSNLSVQRKLVLNIHWKDWCWSWSSNTLATWCEDLQVKIVFELWIVIFTADSSL